MSRMGAWAALKAAACRSDRVLSALRNLVHYVVNYVFEGRRPGDPEGGSRCEKPALRHGADQRRARSPKHSATTPINVAPLKATLGH